MTQKIMKTVAGIFFLLMIMAQLNAQPKRERAPLNPDFVQYVKDLQSGKLKKSAGEKATGYIPSPVQIYFPESTIAQTSKKAGESLPASYDLRNKGWVTSVKDQGQTGACLSFSVMGAIESNWLQSGYGTWDLSEHNLATCHGFEWGIDDGGNFLMAIAYLSRLSGPVKERDDKFIRWYTECKSDSVDIPVVAYTPVMSWLPQDINIVKKAVMDYGGVAASIYTGGRNMYLYYDRDNHTFYYPGTTYTDHAVLIVGWNDNMVVTGGPDSPKGTKGAWIVKNSWGTDWGDLGYFYVSYKDNRFLSDATIFPERAELDEIDTLYMFDKLGSTSSIGYREETGYGLARYVSPEPNFIRKIGTYAFSSGSTIDIEIYDDMQGDTIPVNLIASSYNNVVKLPGYKTFDVPAIVNGDFYVKVKYHSPGDLYPIPVETSVTLQGEAYALPEIQDSGTFWTSRDGEEWQALGKGVEDGDFDLCIRAYADRNTSINAFFTSDKPVVCQGTPVTFESASNGQVDSYEWNFGTGASPATANTAGPHQVTYSTTGKKDISLTITGPSGSRVLNRKKYVEVVDQLDVFLPFSEKMLVRGKSITLTAFGADDYTWSPAADLDTTKGPTVVASPIDTTTYTVNGTMGTCSGSAQITLNVVDNPPNDDICDAYEITGTGEIGTFTNVHATVEAGEPAPPEGDCNTDMEWCVEGGLQNSVWFKFIGPETGVVSIDTRDLDTQIAIYRLDDCDSIFSKTGFEMVAANDDYHSEAYDFAAAIERLDVTPGATYYMQIDGSAGGVEGDFTLYFSKYPLGIDDHLNQDADMLKVYPNPGNGNFNVSLDTPGSENVLMRIYDATGKMIYTEQYLNTKGFVHAVNLGRQTSGVYYLELVTKSSVYRKNILVE